LYGNYYKGSVPYSGKMVRKEVFIVAVVIVLAIALYYPTVQLSPRFVNKAEATERNFKFDRRPVIAEPCRACGGDFGGSCPAGNNCIDGCCWEYYCEDSDANDFFLDGINPEEQGYLTHCQETSDGTMCTQGGIFDECLNDTLLREGYCNGPDEAFLDINCDNGCSEGVCNSAPQCNDVFGRTCSVDDDCFTGEVCLSGCCIDSSCSETDSGRDPSNAGSVVQHFDGLPDSTPVSDSCLDGNTLTEYYCDGVGITSEEINCQSGTCVGGECVEICQIDGVKNNYETDIDCGGRNCVECQNGETCKVSTDCSSGYCSWDGLCEPFPAGINPNCVPIKYEEGTTSGHINIVILGAQYDYNTPFQLNGEIGYDKFLEDTYKIVNGDFLDIAPYSDFSKINIFRVDDISNTDFWIIHRDCINSVNWDCDGFIEPNQGCLSPDQEHWHERACRGLDYSSSFWVTQKLDICGTSSSLPNRFGLIIFNDDHYAGRAKGTTRTLTSIHEDSVEIGKHELLGHGIGDLDDEYVSYSTPYGGGQPSRLNCDVTANCDRWSDLIAAGVPDVDCISGCRYYPSGINRNTDTSLMRKLGYPFFPVNERAICCRFIELTGTYPPSCQFFETTGIPLQQYCASPPALGQEKVTEFWIDEIDGKFVVSDIREGLWRDLSKKSNLRSGLEFEAKDSSEKEIKSFAEVPVLHEPMLVGSDEAPPETERTGSYVVYVLGDSDQVGRLTVDELGKVEDINVKG
jgi:hypothetical protein